MTSLINTSKSKVEQFYTNAYLFSCLCDMRFLPDQTPLICEYAGSDLTGDGQAAFQKRYADRNAGKPEKLQTLNFEDVVDKSSRTATASLLQRWKTESAQMLRGRLGEKVRESLKACNRLSIIAACIVGTSCSETRVTKAVDERGNTLGICLSTINVLNNTINGECVIDYLISSPQNVSGRFSGQRVVEGVGTALVEREVVQLVRCSGLRTITIGLEAFSDAGPFYEKLHFQKKEAVKKNEQGKREITHTLSGDRVLWFMRDFAGRV